MAILVTSLEHGLSPKAQAMVDRGLGCSATNPIPLAQVVEGGVSRQSLRAGTDPHLTKTNCCNQSGG